MYERLKALVPRRMLLALERPLRRVLTLALRGDRFACPVCGSRLRRFLRTSTADVCPACGSSGRARRLWTLLEGGYLRPGLEVLDCSPARCLYRRLRATPGIRYLATDLLGEFEADARYDLRALPLADASFDLAVCWHVLEHIDDDRAAIAELVRVIRPGGTLLVQTPFRDGGIDEDPSVTAPAERARRFGQPDHVRVYSVEGLARRLRDAGFEVERLELTAAPGNRFGFRPSDTVLVATRPAN